jgi:predicted transcriptional regulator YheO
LGDLLGSSCEVVVHDLRQPERSIVALVHGHVTGRVVGGPLIGGPFGDVALRWLTAGGEAVQHQVYETRTRDGRSLKSATTLYRDAQRRPFAALCVNHDVSELVAFQSWANRLRSVPTSETSSPSAVAPTTVDDVLVATIAEVVGPFRAVLATLTRETRTSIVRELGVRGVFSVRGAVRRVAEEMGVSKYTIYGDLEAVRGR